MEQHQDSPSVIDRTSGASDSEKITRSPINTRRLGTLGALLLAFAAAQPFDRPEQKTDDPTVPIGVRLQMDSFLPPSAPIPPAPSGLEDLKISDQAFTCTFKGQRIEGSLNTSGEVTEVFCDGFTIHLSQPISTNTLARFLRNATGSITSIDDHHELSIENGSLTAIGGARYEFVAEHDNIGGIYIATVRDVLKVDAASEVVREKAFTEWKNTLPKLFALGALSSTAKDLRAQELSLRQKAHTRTLLDEQSGAVVTEISSHLSPKNFTREWRQNGILTSTEEYEDDVLTKSATYDSTGQKNREWKHGHYSHGATKRTQEYAVKDGSPSLALQTDFWESGKTRAALDTEKDTFEYFSENGPAIYRETHWSSPLKRDRGMVRADGKLLGDFEQEQANNSDLTPSEYLALLAKHLDTPEKLAVFFEQYLWYASDDGDHWQTAEQTVQRLETYDKTGRRYMRGDCDDYAFLARDILRLQSKNAHVIYIPGHAICIWAETDNDNLHHAYCQDTYGYDKNGNWFGKEVDVTKERGYEKLIDALNALVKKYRYPGLGLPEGQDLTLDPERIWIMPDPPSGNYRQVTVDFFLQKVG